MRPCVCQVLFLLLIAVVLRLVAVPFPRLMSTLSPSAPLSVRQASRYESTSTSSSSYGPPSQYGNPGSRGTHCLANISILTTLSIITKGEVEVLTDKDILPTNLAIPSTQNIPMHAPTPQTPTQQTRSPSSTLHNLHLHTPTHGLRDAELTREHRHLEGVLGGAPLR